MLNNTEITYRYPNNLAEKFMLWLWTPIEMAVVAIVGLFAAILAIDSRNVAWLVPAAGLALLLAHIEDQSIWQVLLSKIRFITGVRVWEYMPGTRKEAVSIHQQDLDAAKKEKARRKRKNNVLSLIAFLMVIAMVIAAAMAS